MKLLDRFDKFSDGIKRCILVTAVVPSVTFFYHYSQLISKGPVSLPSLPGGKVLQLMTDSQVELFTDLPDNVEAILPGPQLPQGRLLLTGGEGLWMLETDQL